MTQLAILRERNEAEIIDGEAVLYHEHAVFDGAVVTGTQTNLKGDFIARIRHTAQSEEGYVKLLEPLVPFYHFLLT